MRYKDLNSSLASHILTLRVLIVILVVICAGMWNGWKNARSDMTIHIPPELSFGANLKNGEVPKANLYTFAGYIFQQLNRWETNGEKNYAEQIFSSSAFLTPSFQKFLISDMKVRHRAGELSGRVRYIQMIPGRGYEERRVDALDNNNWVVWLDFSIHEYVNALKVKTVYIRYPFLVTRYDIDPEKNPWGLALNGFAEPGPKKLTKEQLNGETN